MYLEKIKSIYLLYYNKKNDFNSYYYNNYIQYIYFTLTTHICVLVLVYL